MKPEDVPDELARIAMEGYYGHAVPDGGFAVLRGQWQRALAAVLPAHEAMVRAKVADNVEVAPVCEADQPFMSLLARHIRSEDVSGEVAPGGQIVVPMPEIERRIRAKVAAEIAPLIEAARNALASLDMLIADHSDPGTQALGDRHMLQQALTRADGIARGGA